MIASLTKITRNNGSNEVEERLTITAKQAMKGFDKDVDVDQVAIWMRECLRRAKISEALAKEGEMWMVFHKSHFVI